MKKTNRNLTLGMIVTAIVGSALVKVAESTFGAANVFIFAFTIVGFVALFVVPFLQMKK